VVESGITRYTNIGGATYKGIEGQMAQVLGGGFSLYLNGSVNSAKANDTGEQISGAPSMTAALGGLYNEGAWSGSLIYKRTGVVHQKDYDATKAAISGVSYYDYYKTSAYGNLDLGVAYTLKNVTPQTKNLKLQFNVFNLANSGKITSISTGSTVAQDTYIYQAPRSMMVSLKADF